MTLSLLGKGFKLITDDLVVIKKDKIIIIISHHNDDLKICDKIYKIENKIIKLNE